MSDGFKQHIPVIVAVSAIGFITAAIILMRVHDGAAEMNVSTFRTLIIVVPCAVMLICSFIVTATASSIGRRLYMTMLGICLATGVISMVVTSMWASDPTISAALIANSAEGTTLVPDVNQPLLVLRNLAAYVVMPTVGCIAGAWIGSRLHPIESEGK